MITQVLPLSDLNEFIVTPRLIDPDSMVAVIGDLHRLPKHRISILNSRQRRLPHADDPWLSSTVDAIDESVSKTNAIITSVGMITWEWCLWNTSRLKGHQIIIVPRGKVSTFPDRVEQMIRDFDLDESRAMFLMPFCPKKKSVRKAIYPERDSWVIALSHRILPVAIRPDGIMSKMLAEQEISCKIDTSCQITAKPVKTSQDQIRQLITNSSRIITRIGTDWDYLTHWTRACHGPWHEERYNDFYNDLFRAKTGYPRDGLHTLKRILTEQKIRGSGRLMPGNVPIVSLTQKSPIELLDIIRWRSGFIRWNFEPYGISIKTELLRSMGARPVTYGTQEQFKQLPQNERSFLQRVIPNGKDWRVEEEWRLPGNLELANLSENDAIVWIPNAEQVSEIQRVSRFPVHSLIE
ncbi:hypothetical protein AMJ86_09040 [bacterium SM23_57]|nr:MAG: hypothetical protein AMJ86_09040 [bacterium SM23_57]